MINYAEIWFSNWNFCEWEATTPKTKKKIGFNWTFIITQMIKKFIIKNINKSNIHTLRIQIVNFLCCVGGQSTLWCDWSGFMLILVFAFYLTILLKSQSVWECVRVRKAILDSSNPVTQPKLAQDIRRTETKCNRHFGVWYNDTDAVGLNQQPAFWPNGNEFFAHFLAFLSVLEDKNWNKIHEKII
jgi:hypothetical protein